MVTRALVVGGGGNVGFCWTWGLIARLHDVGVDLTDADLTVGTSSGSTVPLELIKGENPHRLLESLDAPQEAGAERDASAAPEHFIRELSRLIRSSRDPRQIRIEIGAMALAATAESEDALRRAIRSYVAVQDWPRGELLIPAVDAHSGDLTVFSQASGVELIDAVAATCAVPGVWAPVKIGERRYIDGTLWSTTNAHLAAGCDRVLALAPLPEIRGMPDAGLDQVLQPVQARGEVIAVVPDDAARTAMGNDLADLSRRAAAARAGLEQGAALARSIKDFWQR